MDEKKKTKIALIKARQIVQNKFKKLNRDKSVRERNLDTIYSPISSRLDKLITSAPQQKRKKNKTDKNDFDYANESSDDADSSKFFYTPISTKRNELYNHQSSNTNPFLDYQNDNKNREINLQEVFENENEEKNTKVPYQNKTFIPSSEDVSLLQSDLNKIVKDIDHTSKNKNNMQLVPSPISKLNSPLVKFNLPKPNKKPGVKRALFDNLNKSPQIILSRIDENDIPFKVKTIEPEKNSNMQLVRVNTTMKKASKSKKNENHSGIDDSNIPHKLLVKGSTKQKKRKISQLADNSNNEIQFLTDEDIVMGEDMDLDKSSEIDDVSIESLPSFDSDLDPDFQLNNTVSKRAVKRRKREPYYVVDCETNPPWKRKVIPKAFSSDKKAKTKHEDPNKIRNQKINIINNTNAYRSEMMDKLRSKQQQTQLPKMFGLNESELSDNNTLGLPLRRSKRIASVDSIRQIYGNGYNRNDFVEYDSNNRISYEFYDSADELVDRLRLLIGSIEGGNNNISHSYEINSILSELRENDVIE